MVHKESPENKERRELVTKKITLTDVGGLTKMIS